MSKKALEKKKKALYTVSQDDSMNMDHQEQEEPSSGAEDESNTGWSEGHSSSSSVGEDSESSTTISNQSSSNDHESESESSSDDDEEDETEEGGEDEERDGGDEQEGGEEKDEDEENQDDEEKEDETEDEEDETDEEEKEEEKYYEEEVVESSTDSDEESTSTTVSVEEVSKVDSPQVVAKGTYEVDEEPEVQTKDRWGFSLLGKKKSFESADSNVLEIIEDEPTTTDEDTVEPQRKGGLFASLRRGRSKDKVDLQSGDEGEGGASESNKKSIFRGFSKGKESDSPARVEGEAKEEETPPRETTGLFSSLRRSKNSIPDAQDPDIQDADGKLGIAPRDDVDIDMEQDSSDYGTPKQGEKDGEEEEGEQETEEEATPVKQRQSIFAFFKRRKTKESDIQGEKEDVNVPAERDIELGGTTPDNDIEVADAPAIPRKRGIFQPLRRSQDSDESPEIVLPVDMEGGRPDEEGEEDRRSTSRAAGMGAASSDVPSRYSKDAPTSHMPLRRMFLLALLLAIVVSVSTIGTSYYGSKLALENAGVTGGANPAGPTFDACPEDNLAFEFTIAFDNRPDEVGLSLRDSTSTGQAFWLFEPGSFRTLSQMNRENIFFLCLNYQNSYTFEITDTANNGLEGNFAGTPVHGSWKLKYDGFIVATYDGNCNGTDVNECGAYCACDFRLRFNETSGGCRTDC